MEDDVQLAAYKTSRKTSNGCMVAQCVSRKCVSLKSVSRKSVSRKSVECRQPSAYIAAINFSATNLSVAYILPGKIPGHHLHMLPLQATKYHVPATILFNSDGTANSLGWQAFMQYYDLDEGERPLYAYFDKIIMDLQHKKVDICIILAQGYAYRIARYIGTNNVWRIARKRAKIAIAGYKFGSYWFTRYDCHAFSGSLRAR